MKKKIDSIWNKENYGMKVLDSAWYRLIFELQDIFVKASMEFYTAQGLNYMPLPVTTHAISSPMGLGSDSEPVQVIMKNRPVFLADSMQFLLEYASRMADKGAFYLMPSFRGEATDDRHLTEFFHSEAEIRGDLADVMAMIESYTAFLSKRILYQLGEEIEAYTGDVKHLEYMAGQPEIPSVTYQDALNILKDIPGTVDRLPGGYQNINRNGEEYLMKRFGGYVWLTHFDEQIVPFYQASDNGYAKNADLLMGIGETVGAGERHRDGESVREALVRHQVEAAPYDWYIQMKTEKPLTTAGFGMGMERFLLWVLKHDDIRDCQIISRIDHTEMKP